MVAVACRGVSKSFRRYRERNQSLKQAILKRRRHRFESFLALDDVTFEIEEGTSFGIIGGNGAGKSTTLKVLAQILQPDRGEVELHGRVAALLELGAGFHPELSGRENVFLNGAVLGLGRRTLAERLDEIVDFSGLGEFIDSPVKTYSSGMYARLGFAVAVNVDPDVLLIDEVLAVGDEAFQRRCGEKIADLRGDGRTVVIVSHGLSQVQAICDEAMWIDHGHVRGIGSAPDTVNAYLASVSSASSMDETDHGHDDAGETRDERVRYGSGEARFTRVELRRPDGKVIERPMEGQPLDLCFELDVRERLHAPVLGLWFTRSDGILVGATRNQRVLELPLVEPGRLELSFRIDRLPLLPGRYHLGIAVTDSTVQHVYDRYDRYLNFDVLPSGSAQFQLGVVALTGSWRQGDVS